VSHEPYEPGETDAFKRWLYCDEINLTLGQIAGVAEEAMKFAEITEHLAADRLLFAVRRLEQIRQMANRALTMREREYEALARDNLSSQA
jgi:hypothetical protein